MSTRPSSAPPERTEELVARVARALEDADAQFAKQVENGRPYSEWPSSFARAALQSLGYAEMESENARLREALACSQEHIRKMLRARLASKTKHRTALRGDREQGEG